MSTDFNKMFTILHEFTDVYVCMYPFFFLQTVQMAFIVCNGEVEEVIL